jgi:3-deoxy-D-manno-octulosonic-acid transferase
MYLIYDILVYLASFFLKILAFFDPKIKKFVSGRQKTFPILKDHIAKSDKVIWIHCASLGEFEQGRPVMEALKATFPKKKLVLTFFSPSGYEIRKSYKLADVVCYLPMDTHRHSKKFLDLVHPEMVIFVKYEFWPNILRLLGKEKIKTMLVSGIFRPNQSFFKWYGKGMKNSLDAFTHFFVQDENSKMLLQKIGYDNVQVTGDTRFDRVIAITSQDNTLGFMDQFKGSNHLLVAGSTWKEDEDLLVSYINKEATEREKFVIVPHNIHELQVEQLRNTISKEVVLYSEHHNSDLTNYQVLILDTIGILTKVYSYADVAYIGGGFTKSGVHNILEPATYGIPIVIGPNYNKFKEVIDLVGLKACYSIDDSKKLSVILARLMNEEPFRSITGKMALQYVMENKGATKKIINFLK